MNFFYTSIYLAQMPTFVLENVTVIAVRQFLKLIFRNSPIGITRY
jgi:hypothetical protein